MVFTFDPSPKAFFAPESAPLSLFTAQQKLQAFRELHVQWALMQPFDKDFSLISADNFITQILWEELGADCLMVGHDFRFGHQRAGDVQYLQKMGRVHGISVTISEPLTLEGEPISSSRIRAALQQPGDWDLIARMLGRPYCLEGTVVSGRKIGRSIGIPTANLQPVEQLIPRSGVYAGYVNWEFAEGQPRLMSIPPTAVPAVFNIGERPTVGGDRTMSIEAHLLRQYPEGDFLYGKEATYFLSHRLRDEQRFASLIELKAQIQADIQRAKGLLNP